MYTKDQILNEIKRAAKQNGGVPLGIDRFCTETGIKSSDYLGKFWARYSDALVEAGFQANQLNGKREDENILENLALLVRELGHFPVKNEILLKARSTPGFPWDTTIARLGNRKMQASRLREFTFQKGYDDVVLICDEYIGRSSKNDSEREDVGDSDATETGLVYLMKSGKHYKIGRTNSLARRKSEISIQLPEATNVIHSISTDDAAGIEAYWHKRFQDKRKNGEWFELTLKDVAAFRRRKFM